MQRILLGLAMTVFAGAVIVGATGAFFSDTETSTGNSFTAGSIDLKVDSTAHYDGLKCVANEVAPGFHWAIENQTTSRPDLVNQPCDGSWELKDLLPTADKFFNFTDVKPGDSGENTISLHIDNNDAYACADVSNVQNNENTHLAPEIAAGDTTATDPNAGELGQNLDFLIWNDNGVGAGHAGNNIWDADEVGSHSHGAPLTPQTYTLADGSGTPIPATGTSYLGVAWCAGTFTAGGPGVAPVCDGSLMGNQSQTDSYSADVGIRVVQARNNGAFRCTPPVVGEGQKVGAALATYVAPASCTATVTGANSVQAAIEAAAPGSTVCVDGTYTGAGDTGAIQLDKNNLTLAATTQGVAILHPVELDNDGTKVTGFTGTVGQVESPSEVAAFYLNSLATNATISYNTVVGDGVHPDILTETAGTNSGGVIENNVLSGGLQGIYLNPHTGLITIQKNDINNNVVGIGNLTGALVQNNQFNHATPGQEAIGAGNGVNGDYDGSTVQFNNFLNGIKINTYTLVGNVTAPNNFFNLTGTTQETGESVNFTPEAAVAYAHN